MSKDKDDLFRDADRHTVCPDCGNAFAWNVEDGLEGQACACGYEFNGIYLLEGKLRLLKAEGNTSTKVESDLEREVCPFCDSSDCCFSCDGSKAEYEGPEEAKPQSEEEVAGRLTFNGGLDALESMLLAAACAGLIPRSEDPRWNDIIETALDALGNNC